MEIMWMPLERARTKLKRRDPAYTGTMYAASRRMNGVGAQSLENLLTGRTQPSRVTVHLMTEVLRVFRGCGLTQKDFTH